MPKTIANNTATLSLSITSLSHDGRGIAHVDGKTVFVDGALPGEQVSAVYVKRHSKYDEARATSINVAATDRTTPQCAHFGVCGGCSLQHMSSSAQLKFKQQVLLEQLRHIGNTEPKEVLPPLTSPVWGYRRKARLGIRYVIKKGKILVGFREKNSRYLADLQGCQVLHPLVGTRFIIISQLISQLDAYLYIPQIEVAVGDDATALILRHLQPLNQADLEKLHQFAIEQNYHIFLQPGGPETVHLLAPRNGNVLLSYQLHDQHLTLQFKPNDFVQVNSKVNRQMIARALQLLAPQPNDTILDLFCGLGNFTLPLAKHCQRVIGVEGDDGLVKRAKNNAHYNQITNAEFYSADLTTWDTAAPWAQKQYQKILLDPPRSGAYEIIDKITAFGAEKILYVSCNPATLARDAGELIKQGYQLTHAGIMDMFPHTSHVEAIALFCKNE